MAAAAFKVSLQVKNLRTGGTFSYYLTASDVNGAAMVWPSAATEPVLSGDPLLIYDAIFSAAGTDTTNSSVFIGGVDSSIKFIHSACLGSVINRQVAVNPIRIPAGTSVKIVQNT